MSCRLPRRESHGPPPVSANLEGHYIYTSERYVKNWQRGEELATVERLIKRYSVS
jgi:hypothetical protein